MEARTPTGGSRSPRWPNRPRCVACTVANLPRPHRVRCFAAHGFIGLRTMPMGRARRDASSSLTSATFPRASASIPALMLPEQPSHRPTSCAGPRCGAGYCPRTARCYSANGRSGLRAHLNEIGRRYGPLEVRQGRALTAPAGPAVLARADVGHVRPRDHRRGPLVVSQQALRACASTAPIGPRPLVAGGAHGERSRTKRPRWGVHFAVRISTGQADALFSLDGLNETNPGPRSSRFQAPSSNSSSVMRCSPAEPQSMARPAEKGCVPTSPRLRRAPARVEQARKGTGGHRLSSFDADRPRDRRRSSTCVFPPAAPPLLDERGIRAAFIGRWRMTKTALALLCRYLRSPLTALRLGRSGPQCGPAELLARWRNIPRGGGWRCSDRRGRERCGRAGDHLRRRRRSGRCGTGCVPAGGRGQRPAVAFISMRCSAA